MLTSLGVSTIEHNGTDFWVNRPRLMLCGCNPMQGRAQSTTSLWGLSVSWEGRGVWSGEWISKKRTPGRSRVSDALELFNTPFKHKTDYWVTHYVDNTFRSGSLWCKSRFLKWCLHLPWPRWSGLVHGPARAWDSMWLHCLHWPRTGPGTSTWA